MYELGIEKEGRKEKCTATDFFFRNFNFARLLNSKKMVSLLVPYLCWSAPSALSKCHLTLNPSECAFFVLLCKKNLVESIISITKFFKSNHLHRYRYSINLKSKNWLGRSVFPPHYNCFSSNWFPEWFLLISYQTRFIPIKRSVSFLNLIPLGLGRLSHESG